MAWPSSIPTFATGIGGVTVSKLNDLRDALKALGDAGGTYTPMWSASITPPTMGATTVTGSYRLTNKWATIHILATVGAGFAAGAGVYRFSLPGAVTPLRTTTHDSVGTCIVWDASGSAAYPLSLFQSTSTQVAAVNAVPTAMGPTVPVTWATGDTVSIHIVDLELA